MKLNQLLKGDARFLLEILRARRTEVDLIVTSPPYWDMKDYGGIEKQIGFGQSKENYLADMERILSNCFDLTKETGSLWLIVDSYRRNGELELLPFELASIAKKIGWKLREHIIWDKQYSLPWHVKGQMRDTSESIFFFSKSDDYKFYVDRIKTLDEISKWWVDFPERFNPKGKTPTNIWRFPTRKRGSWPNPSTINHLCPFPTGLVARVIELTTDEGDLVFDPFAGSGIVLAVAEVLKRKFIGTEINPAYVEMYKNEVRKAVTEEWASIKQWRNTMQKSQLSFETSILNLRALKYSRKISKIFTDSLDPEQRSKVKAVICIAQIPSEHNPGNPFNVDTWIIGERNHREFRPALDVAREKILKPPLAHFEIAGEINSGRIEDLLTQRGKSLSKKKFYLYPSQLPRKFVGEESLGTWLSGTRLAEMRNGTGTPPMLANIAEDVAWVLD